MNIKSLTKTEKILFVMKILAWITFFGFSIQTTMYIISYILSWFNPEGTWFAFQRLNLYELKEQNFLKYSVLAVCLIGLTALKANVWYRVTQIIQNIKMENPFTLETTHRLEKISYILFGIWILWIIGKSYNGWLAKTVEIGNVYNTFDSSEFLFMAGLLFIVSQIFKRGVELQSENDLTV